MSQTETEDPTQEPQEPQPSESPQEPEPENPDAEPVEPIEPPSEPPETPPETTQPEPSSYARTQEQDKKLTAEQKRHTAKVADALGDAANDAVLCPFCDPQMQGFFFMEDLEHPRDELQARMAFAYLDPGQAEYQPATDVARCDACDGYGVTKTGSRKPGNETKACARCKGYGFFPPPGQQSNGALNQDQAHELVLAGNHEPVQDDSDPWGSPRLMADGQENPNYGKMPQYKNPDLP